MIEVNNLHKTYDQVTALDDVSFSVRAGEVIGLLGPNGAGKTTLMKILTGFLQPDSGTANIGGYDVLEHPEKSRLLIGYLPENAPLYPEITVQSYLKMIADLRMIDKKQQQERLSTAIITTGLTDHLTVPIAKLSKGYRQRVGLAQAIVHRPKLLILDEPTNGLDPTQIVQVRNLIKDMAAHSTVLISTHILSEVEATCDRAIIIIDGKIKKDAQLAALAQTRNALLTMHTENADIPRALLAALPGVGTIKTQQKSDQRIRFTIESKSGNDLCPALFQLAKKHDWQLCELHQEKQTLEAVFNELTKAGAMPK